MIQRVMLGYETGKPGITRALKGMKEVAERMGAGLRQSDLAGVGSLLSENWRYQRLLDPGMRTDMMGRLEQAVESVGVLGGKAAGAGAGGCMFFLATADPVAVAAAARGRRGPRCSSDDPGSRRGAHVVTADQLEARRALIEGSSDLQALLHTLQARAQPVLARMPPVPRVKALLSRQGGICPNDGAALLFDPWSPTAHRCPSCGTVVERAASPALGQASASLARRAGCPPGGRRRVPQRSHVRSCR